MRFITKSMALALVAGAAVPALAQDSTSSVGTGLPGDALSAYDANQTRAYVVDLAELVTSKGTRFGVAPIMKTSRVSSGFFNSLTSAQSVSPDLLTGVPYASANGYEFWNQPKFGVHRVNNLMGNVVTPTGASNQLCATVVTFATNEGGFNYGGVVSALVNYDPADPSRLFVKRVQSAVNAPDQNSGDTAQIGGVSIDANGNNYFRADNFGAVGAPIVAGNNWYRVNIDLRNPAAVNQISGGATFDATDGLLIGSATTHVPPSVIAESVVGFPGVVSGGNFNNEWVRGAGALTNDTTQLVGSATRGTLGGTPKRPLASGVWTHAMLNQDAAGNTTILNVWSATAGMTVAEKYAFSPPAIVSDPCDPYDLLTAIPGVFTLYQSQAAFRGGVGTVAVGADGAERGLVAATFDEFDAGSNSPFNHILVARFNEDGSSVEWTLAAWTDALNSGAGKPVCDENGDPIGVLTYLSNIPGAPLGPSMSAPAIDGAGNVWFLSAVELFNRIDSDGDTIPDASDFDSALIRAIYDPTAFCYRLELVLELGQVIHGVNSDTDYQIQFLEIADSNSVSSGSFFSANARGTAWDNAPVAGMDPADPKSNGGVVLAAEIVYDVDGDGDFDDPTSANGDPLSPDESYQALLFVGQAPAPANPGCNDADLAPPFGVLDFSDVIAFLTAFGSMDPAADLAAPFGVFDFSDVIAFLSAFGAGCP